MARRAPLFSRVAQLSGSAFCGKRTTPPFCRCFCRSPQTPSSSKALVPVALRASHALPQAPRLRGAWGWERPPFILGMDGPETGGFCRPSCRFRGRSQPAPPARVIPAGRQLRDDGATPAPALVEFLEEPAHVPRHPLTAPYLTLRYGAFPGPADVPILDFNAPQHPLFPGFAGFSGPPRARIGIVSRITTRGLPLGVRSIPARPNGYRRAGGTLEEAGAYRVQGGLQRGLVRSLTVDALPECPGDLMDRHLTRVALRAVDSDPAPMRPLDIELLATEPERLTQGSHPSERGCVPPGQWSF